ncbi:MAG TPA: hypothetical protein VNZ26_32805 [Vicinamibacterales bacterium]|jgi:hypothetical protein|nr:hypothetical protein [Vicinamibacterales bacterium]
MMRTAQPVTTASMDDRTRLPWVAIIFVLVLPVCFGTQRLPLLLVAALYTAYPLLFILWLFVLVWTLRALASRYGTTPIKHWWWWSVPYSLALPTLALLLGLRDFSFWHMLAPFLLPAFLTVPAAALWTVTTLVSIARGKASIGAIRVELGAVPLAIVAWAIVLMPS